MKTEFFPLDLDYDRKENAIKIFGRTKEGKKIIVLDSSEKPYFWVIPKKNAEKVKKQIENVKYEDEDKTYRVLKAEVKAIKYFDEPIKAIKVILEKPSDKRLILDLISGIKGIDSRKEVDIPLKRRYWIEKGLIPLILCEVEGEEKKGVIKAKKITEKKESYEEPKILAFDIETYAPTGRYSIETKDPIMTIAIYGKNLKKVVTWKKFYTEEEYIIFKENEGEMIKEFMKIVNDYNPDYMVGYYSDAFDMPYIRTRAEKNKINFRIAGEKVILRRGTAKTKGIIHLDIFNFIKHVMGYSLKTENYDLDSVSKELIGEGKIELDLVKAFLAWDAKSPELEKLCEYNLNDAEITYKLARKIMPNINELTKLVSQPAVDIVRMSYGQMVEWYLIRKAHQYKEICPNRPGADKIGVRRMNTYKGGFVYEPKPGLYENLTIVDFKGLYPSIIVTHNISAITYTEKNGVKTPPVETSNGKKVHYHFKRKEGFITKAIKELIEKRNEVKKELAKNKKDSALIARSYALKTVANASYGYMGFFAARWYSKEAAEAVTAYGRHYIKDTIKKAKKEFEVVYGDSLHPTRKIFIKNKEGEIKLIKIGEFVDKHLENSKISHYQTLAFDGKKLVFSTIKRAIRHKYNKKKGTLLEFVTSHGKTIVTPQHSVYCYDNKIKLTDAKELKIGDFLISFTNPPASEIFKENHVFDITRLNLGPYKNDLYLYPNNLRFKKENGICPYCKKKAMLRGHVFRNHKIKKVPIKLADSSEFLFIGGENTKSGRIPRYWKLTKELAWILGYFAADGSASERNKKHKKEMISFGSQDKKTIEKVKRIFENIIDEKLKIIEDFDKRINKKMYYYRIQRMSIVALFVYGFGLGKGSHGKKVPNFILNSPGSIKKVFLEGYLHGDGTKSKDKRYKTHFQKISTKSIDLALGLQYIFKSSENKKINHFNKKIEHIHWHYRKDKPKIVDLRFQSVRKKEFDNFCLAKIKKINKIKYQGYVYDLEIEKIHNFVDAEGMILVHNTDSIILLMGNKKITDVKKFLKKINDKLPGYMELELEGFFPRGIFVMKKGEKVGAKKKYALLNEEGEIIVKGFETIRRDWSKLAKNVQRKVLKIILKENLPKKALDYVQDVINDIRKKKFDIEDMIIQTTLQKPLETYQQIGPHVAVARRMLQQGMFVTTGSTIFYVVTEGKGQIRDRARTPQEAENYDPEYYVNNQIIPAIERIFEALGYKKEDLIKEKEQTTLGDF